MGGLRESAGNRAAHMTAKMVMASAKRLMALRQPCLKSNRMAEISVPAWPMPIHHTKLMIANPQATGCVNCPDAHALEEEPGQRHHEHHGPAAGNREQPEPAHGRVRRKHDARNLFGNRPEGLTRRNHPVFAGCGIDPMIRRFYFSGRHLELNPSPAQIPSA